MSQQTAKTSLATLSLAAIGIVYGDIGTSPLYTMKEVFSSEHGVPLTEANLLGAVSLIVWGLTAIVSLKYVALILRADNRGEGGIMALMALAMSAVGKSSRWHVPVMLIGLTGAALFFGDGVITPAISVLSAIEGLEVATPAFTPYVVPITAAVIICLYAVQWHGTARIGRLFGPIVLLWFFVLGAMGIVNIAANPIILRALNPLYAFQFFTHNGGMAFIALGAIFLAFTGAEALYADMGHFGKKPIRLAWFCVVFPALSLNYLGQGGLLLANPAAVANPFYHQLGAWSVYPLVVLATMATVIASQATISATFSVTQQAISLGFLPRMRVEHTSSQEIGQIYIPIVNWLQLAVVLLAVVGFGSSSNLAAAYGIAVTMTMLTTTILTFFVIRFQWKYNLLVCWAATGCFLFVDLAFFSANTLKIAHGGWFPLLLGGWMMVVLLTWHRGRELVFENLRRHFLPLSDFLRTLFTEPPERVAGTAVYFRADGDGVPHALLHNLLHNKIIHERIIFLTVIYLEIPTVPDAERMKVEALGHDCYQVSIMSGFKDEADIPEMLARCDQFDQPFEIMETSFFVARHTVVPTIGSGMMPWRENLFAIMSRNARDAADYYHVPPNRVIELGAQIEI